MKTICLNMIVKNEQHVIARCLEPLKGIIDCWVIVDTGSTDRTKELIRNSLKGIPGELHDRPWRDFEYNRNEALELARGKADYILFLDADEKLHIFPSFQKSQLTKDVYFLKVIGTGQEFYFPKIIRSKDPKWRWVGALHESLQYEGICEEGWLLDLWVESKQDGARSLDPERDAKDIAILEQMVKRDPKDPRSYFYLAQTYFNAQDFDRAFFYYTLRSEMEGAHDESFWSLFILGQIEEMLQKNPESRIQRYLKAHQFDPARAEPLERIANQYLQEGKFDLSYKVLKHAKTLPLPASLSAGCYGWVYHFGIDALLADCAVQMRKMEEAKELYRQLLKKTAIPEQLKVHVRGQLALLDRWFLADEGGRKRIVFPILPIRINFRFR